MINATVDDKHAVYAVADRIFAAIYFRDHAARNDPLLNECGHVGNVHFFDQAFGVVFIFEQSADIGHENKTFRL